MSITSQIFDKLFQTIRYLPEKDIIKEAWDDLMSKRDDLHARISLPVSNVLEYATNIARTSRDLWYVMHRLAVAFPPALTSPLISLLKDDFGKAAKAIENAPKHADIVQSARIEEARERINAYLESVATLTHDGAIDLLEAVPMYIPTAQERQSLIDCENIALRTIPRSR